MWEGGELKREDKIQDNGHLGRGTDQRGNEGAFRVLEMFYICAAQYSTDSTVIVTCLLSALNVVKSALRCTESMKYTGNFSLRKTTKR